MLIISYLLDYFLKCCSQIVPYNAERHDVCVSLPLRNLFDSCCWNTCNFRLTFLCFNNSFSWHSVLRFFSLLCTDLKPKFKYTSTIFLIFKIHHTSFTFAMRIQKLNRKNVNETSLTSSDLLVVQTELRAGQAPRAWNLTRESARFCTWDKETLNMCTNWGTRDWRAVLQKRIYRFWLMSSRIWDSVPLLPKGPAIP